MEMIDLSPLPPAQREAASTVAWSDIGAQDATDRAALDALLPRRGWLTISACGRAASDAAWSDPGQADQRLKALGLTNTEEQVEARIATYAPCFPPKHKG